MLNVLGQKHPSSKPASTRVNSHQLPFSKPLGFFPPVGGIPLTDTNPNGLRTHTLDLEGISMTFPAIATLQELELGTVTTIDEDIYEGSIYGSSLMGKAQGMYVASSENGSSHMMAMTTSFLSNDYEDSLRFFGVHRGDVFESHIAVIGGTGKYHDANGYATVKIVNETSNKSEGAYKILSFNVYLARLLDEVSQVADASSETDEPVVAPVVAPVATLPPATVTAPDSDVAPAADPSVPADTVAPPADLPAEPEPDSAPVIAPAGSVAPPTDLTDTGAAPVANAAPDGAAAAATRVPQ
ncbi:hypothetical protein RND71_028883 [Anisodus tanguticus]|uniref:Dirigent protein n=1 Tax=Anisodus tanguticus TaxID=243964 RepID=A0AAE1VAG4_9SOLA|nr:hypothetical protein RND71_028883 [Anisodus tanguticus]